MRNYALVTERRQGKRKKGFTLTEIAIVLGIMGLILGAIWVAAAGVYTNQRVNQANTAVMQILQAVRTLYAQQATMPTGDQTAALINAGVIPTNLISGTTMKTPWGAPMYVTGTGDNIGVAIIMNGMDAPTCVGLVSTVAGASHDRTLSGDSETSNTAFGAGAAGVITTGFPLVSSPAPTTSALVGTTIWGQTPPNTGCIAGISTNAVMFIFGLQG